MGKGFAKESAKTSCNYGIGLDGKIGMYVEEKDRSWCSSNRENDHRAITIECASDSKSPYAINDLVYNSLIKLCADICRRNNIKELKWKADKSLVGKVDQQNMTVHRWFRPSKSCPGDYIYERLGRIADEVNKMLGSNEDVKVEKPVEDVAKTESYSLTAFVKDVQKAFGAKVDGVAGSETLSKTLAISQKYNRKHAVVKPIQKRLYVIGYTEVGAVDGIAGPKFTAAVKHYQADNGCVVDGIISARKKTWRKLLGME
jgi:hypothetical protein